MPLKENDFPTRAKISNHIRDTLIVGDSPKVRNKIRKEEVKKYLERQKLGPVYTGMILSDLPSYEFWEKE